MSDELVLLQISDLHVGERFAERTGQRNRSEKQCCKELLKTLELRLKSYKKSSVDLLDLNGDFANTGHCDQFKVIVEEFVDPLLTKGLLNSNGD